jgi:hypothetical protein
MKNVELNKPAQLDIDVDEAAHEKRTKTPDNFFVTVVWRTHKQIPEI